MFIKKNGYARGSSKGAKAGAPGRILAHLHFVTTGTPKKKERIWRAR